MLDRDALALAARSALRGAGLVEPNPLVGAVLVKDGRVIGAGHHRRYGHAHAEVEALNDARARAIDPRGSTMYVTLEPCNHQGKQPPCADAILGAGIAEVVIARADPNPIAAGGADKLRAAGVRVRFTDACPAAALLTGPFVKRVTTDLPWVIAKWAQTVDGRIATRTGESRWISSEASRRRVHALRARVDGVLTGIGTVLADDPALTPRHARHVRRVAARVVVDPRIELPLASRLAESARDIPVICAATAAARVARADRWAALARAGVEALDAAPATRPGAGPLHLDLHALFAQLRADRAVSTLLVEAGPRLLGALLAMNLVDEAIVFIAPTILADDSARPAAVGLQSPRLADALRMNIVDIRRSGDDAMLTMRR
jgi:diaminohydroxyphosphoribosylaminopyrimidine deaminase/5-amino-6-(5-phosphoribosylamino)uracil reductase